MYINQQRLEEKLREMRSVDWSKLSDNEIERTSDEETIILEKLKNIQVLESCTNQELSKMIEKIFKEEIHDKSYKSVLTERYSFVEKYGLRNTPIYENGVFSWKLANQGIKFGENYGRMSDRNCDSVFRLTKDSVIAFLLTIKELTE